MTYAFTLLVYLTDETTTMTRIRTLYARRTPTRLIDAERAYRYHDEDLRSTMTHVYVSDCKRRCRRRARIARQRDLDAMSHAARLPSHNARYRSASSARSYDTQDMSSSSSNAARLALERMSGVISVVNTRFRGAGVGESALNAARNCASWPNKP